MTRIGTNAHFKQAVQAWAEGNLDMALHEAQRATEQEPDHAVYAEAATYLNRVRQDGLQNVYVSPEGFRAFIRGGGNVPLYERTSAALRQVYAEYRAISLLDIGVGDGLALLPALTESVQRIDLVEPSAELLAQTSAALQARNVPYQAYCGRLQQFAAERDGHWTLAQATYSFQSVRPTDRAAMLQWLRAHVERMLIVEFDAPVYAGGADPQDFLSERRLDYVVSRYGRGLAEYASGSEADRAVAQGFLMPVFFGYFDRSASGDNRTNWEQPLAAWAAALREAGFARVEIRPVFDYWWAPAGLIDAQ